MYLKYYLRMLILGFLLITFSSCRSLTRPYNWYDKQGHDIVSNLRKECNVPFDPMSVAPAKGIYHCGWSYLGKDDEWVLGSCISIYGVVDENVQNDIIDKTRSLLFKNNYTDVKILFKERSKFCEVKVKNSTTRIRRSVKERKEIIVKNPYYKPNTNNP